MIEAVVFPEPKGPMTTRMNASDRWKRRNVGAYNWGFVAGRTQTYLPWDSWQQPYATLPDEWFSDLIHPDGRAHNDDEIRFIQKLTGVGRPA